MERIIQDELLIRTREQLNEHQHGFLANKSCTTNLIIKTKLSRIYSAIIPKK